MRTKIYLTFAQWDFLGFYVKKGEKSGKRGKDGIPLFSEDQVIDSEEYEMDDWEVPY